MNMKDYTKKYVANYKMMLREIKGDLNKQRDIFCLWVRRFNIVKMLVLLKLFD